MNYADLEQNAYPMKYISPLGNRIANPRLVDHQIRQLRFIIERLRVSQAMDDTDESFITAKLQQEIQA